MSRGSPPARVAQAWAAVTPPREEVDLMATPRSTRPASPCPLARHLVTLRGMTPERRTDAALADLAEQVSRSLHQVAERHKPNPRNLLEGLPPADRQETLVWLVQAYDVMNFTDGALFDTALLLDRYYAAQPREDSRGGSSQRKLLAAVCMALKTGSEDTQLPVRQVVAHLGRDQVPFDEVLAAELAMLKKLKFFVGTPTARDFLEALSTRLHGDRGTHGVCANLAEFLLQLTLCNADLHYKYAHAVLAAGCLALALFATSAPPSAYVVLLEDLALHCPESASPHGMLVLACADLHQLWIQSVSWSEQQNARSFARNVCTKFSHASRQSVSNLPVPEGCPVSFPPVQSWVPTGDDLQEAVMILQHSIDANEFDTSRCARCDRTWRMPEPHGGLCTSCGSEVSMERSRAQEEAMWTSSLAAQLRPAAESSYRVRTVLTRHGWANGRFRRPPDRQRLHLDLIRASRGRNTERPASAATSVGTVADRAMVLGRPTTMSAASPAATGTVTLRAAEVQQAAAARGTDDARRRRASSWAGQRSSTRVTYVISRSP